VVKKRGSVGESDSESSGDYSSSDGEPVDAVQSHFSQLTASEWQKVDTFAGTSALASIPMLIKKHNTKS
jgi:hypothetical protein